MAKITANNRLIREDFKQEDYQLVDKIAFILNPLLDQLSSAFNKNITFDENINCEIRSIDVTVDRYGIPISDTLYQSKLTRVKGIVVINSQSIATNLTNRLNKTITAISAATSAVITTGEEHGLSTGNVVAIDNSNSTPVVDGLHEVVILTPTKFQIPFTTTIVGTSGNMNLNFNGYTNGSPMISFIDNRSNVKIQHITGLFPNLAYRLTILAIG